MNTHHSPIDETKDYFVFCDGSAPKSSLEDLQPGYFCSVILKSNGKNHIPWAGVPEVLEIGPKCRVAAIVCGHHEASTSPRMEFVAAFEALKWIAKRSPEASVTLASDHENLIRFLTGEYKCSKGCESVVKANGGKLDAANKFVALANLSIRAEHVNASHAKNKTRPTHFLNQVSDFLCTLIEPAGGFRVTTITDGSSKSGKETRMETYV
jgi:ribonuclease HI